MKNIILPPHYGSEKTLAIPRDRHLSLVGGNGAGKSRFMEEMIRQAGKSAWPVGAVDDSFPAVPNTLQREFTDFLEAEAVKDSPLFRHIRNEWQALFHDTQMLVTEDERLVFATSSGTDLIDIGRLSRGERAGLYYTAKVLTAPRGSVIFVDSPTLFLHPTIVGPLWNRLEHLRPDCRFVYDSTDPDFIGSRLRNIVVWVKSYHSEDETWEYELLPVDKAGPVFVDLIGSRRPVLFIEGDIDHSIDSRLYTLLFPQYTIRPLGSCDKVIETTRTFRYLKQYHPLETKGIVDRDRRSDQEVDYLRRRSIMVSEVAEVENIFLSEKVIRIMASSRGLDPERTFNKVSNVIFDLFERMADDQALQHTRYRIKRDVERKIDARFTCITGLELHIKGLIHTLHPREIYNELSKSFHSLLRSRNYKGILKIFNYKPMLTGSSIPNSMGFGTSDEYIEGVLRCLRSDPVNGPILREAILELFPSPTEIKEEALAQDRQRHTENTARHDPEHRSATHNSKKNRRHRRHEEPVHGKMRYKSKRKR